MPITIVKMSIYVILFACCFSSSISIAQPVDDLDACSSLALIRNDSNMAVAVGPRSVLTAAHIFKQVDNLMRPSLGGKEVELCCDTHPGVDPGFREYDIPDLALCRIVDDSDEDLDQVHYENINLDADLENKASTVVLTGHRCRHASIGRDSSTYESVAKVLARTKKTESGAPALVVVDRGRGDTDREGYIILGINSRNRCSRRRSRSSCSLIASTSAARDWIEAWARGEAGSCHGGQETKVCGVNGFNADKDRRCRRLSPSPASQDEPTEVDPQPRR